MKPPSEETTVLFVPSAAEAACKWRAADVVGTGSARGAKALPLRRHPAPALRAKNTLLPA